MGADGGSIPRRDELVKTKERKAREDPSVLLAAAWFFCALSKEPLRQPIVSCGYGKLYNREAILQLLLDRTSFVDAEEVCPHISSLKDVTTLKLQASHAAEECDEGDAVLASSAATLDMAMKPQFECPVSGKEMNGKHRFLYLAPCGHVFSDQALRQVPSKTCMQCSRSYDAVLDMIPLNPRPDELPELQKLLRERRVWQKERRATSKKEEAKDKKRKPQSDSESPSSEPAPRKRPTTEPTSSSAKQETARGPKVNTSLAAKLSLAAGKDARKSSAIASIYRKSKDQDRKSGNNDFFVRGTFNRY